MGSGHGNYWKYMGKGWKEGLILALYRHFWCQKSCYRSNAMARAKRHFIPGYIWHLTHRCHKREFLLKFARDRRRWLYWLYQARKRYGLTILNYMVTSNHIHLPREGRDFASSTRADDGDREVIPKSIKLITGRKGGLPLTLDPNLQKQ